MIKLLFKLTALFLISTICGNAQTKQKSNEQSPQAKQISSSIPIIKLTEKDKPLDLAKAALKVHGGEKLKNVKTLILRGSVEATPPGFPQTLPGTFVIVQADEKSRLQINLSVFGFIQVSDGQTTSSTLTQIDLPPLTRYGLLMLGKIQEKGYAVSESEKKTPFAFSLTSPDGDVVDYTLDSKTGRVKSCFITTNTDQNQITTALEYTKFREVNETLMPEEFFQRIDLGDATAYVKYKAKDILVNTKVDDDVFVLKSQ